MGKKLLAILLVASAAMTFVAQADSHEQPEATAPEYCWPTKGPVTGWFGDARRYWTHAGIDITAPRGQAIRAVASGYVYDIRYSSSGGFIVELQHDDGTRSRYMHMFDKGDYWNRGYNATVALLPVREGDRVRACQVVGYVGNSGNSTCYHLHFSFIGTSGWNINPLGVRWSTYPTIWGIYDWRTRTWDHCPVGRIHRNGLPI